MWSSVSFAGSITWESLPDRERLTLSRSEIEGIPGQIARVSPKGILIPYSEVPQGMSIVPPEGATLFNGTRQLGRALAIQMKTPEFGFVVASRTNVKVVLEFFNDPLGARWKATKLPPVTDVSPNYAVAFGKANATSPDPTAPHVSWGVAEDPFSPDNRSEQALPIVPQDPPLNAPIITSNGDLVSPLSNGTARMEVQEDSKTIPAISNGTSIPPSVVQENSSAISTNGSSIIVDKSANSTAKATPQTSLQEKIAVPEIDKRSAPLPAIDPITPQPSAEKATKQQESSAHKDQSTGASHSSVPSEKKSPSPAPGAAPAIPIIQAGAPVKSTGKVSLTPNKESIAVPVVESSPARDTAISIALNGTSKEAVSKDSKDLPTVLPGVGIRVDQVHYRGKINPSGVQAIPAVTEDDLIKLYPMSSAQGGNTTQNSPSKETLGSGDKALSAEGAEASVDEKSKEISSENKEAKEEGGEKVAEGEGEVAEQPIIFLDDKGQPLPAPVNPTDHLALAREDMAKGMYEDALEKLNTLLNQQKLSAQQTSGDHVENPFVRMTPQQMEEAFHMKAETLFVLNKDTLQENYKEVTDATIQAISYNNASPRNADALLRLGYINLRLSNLPEAESFFGQFRRQFPDHKNIPLTYYYWGDYFYNRGEFERAANQFQTIMAKYPSSPYVKEAALGYARSNYRMGYYDEALQTIKFIESKWKWFYLDYPPFLNMVGDVAYRLGDLDYALQHYWLYINISPSGDEADVILTRIGDIYALQHQSYASTAIYKDAARRFPDKDGGLVAKMRLAEQKINDNPTIANMYDIFEDKETLTPEQDYQHIIDDYPDSSLVPLAELKLAMWYLWKQEYLRVLDTSSLFMKKYSNHELAPRMKEIALKTFAILSAESVTDGSYGRMKSVWEQYPILQGQEEILTPESRIALGVGYWKDGKPDDALVAVEPFFLGKKIPKFSEMALNLVLTIYLEYNEWGAIEEVNKRVQLWNLEHDAQRQLDYALALAYKNTAQATKATPLWEKIYRAGELPNDQLGFAAYYLARDAQDNQRYDDAYLYGVDALKRLKQAASELPEQADNGKILSQLAMLKTLTENSGRLSEALDYANEYLGMLTDTDQESRASTLYQVARIKKNQGDEGAWKKGLEDIVSQYPTSIWGQKASTDLRLSTLDQEEKKFTSINQ